MAKRGGESQLQKDSMEDISRGIAPEHLRRNAPESVLQGRKIAKPRNFRGNTPTAEGSSLFSQPFSQQPAQSALGVGFTFGGAGPSAPTAEGSSLFSQPSSQQPAQSAQSAGFTFGAAGSSSFGGFSGFGSQNGASSDSSKPEAFRGFQPANTGPSSAAPATGSSLFSGFSGFGSQNGASGNSLQPEPFKGFQSANAGSSSAAPSTGNLFNFGASSVTSSSNPFQAPPQASGPPPISQATPTLFSSPKPSFSLDFGNTSTSFSASQPQNASNTQQAPFTPGSPTRRNIRSQDKGSTVRRRAHETPKLFSNRQDFTAIPSSPTPPNTSTSDTGAATNPFGASPNTLTFGMSAATNPFEAPSNTLTPGISGAINPFGTSLNPSMPDTGAVVNPFGLMKQDNQDTEMQSSEAPQQAQNAGINLFDSIQQGSQDMEMQSSEANLNTSTSGTSVATNPFETTSSTTASGTSAATNPFEAPSSTTTSGANMVTTSPLKTPSTPSTSGTSVARNPFGAESSTNAATNLFQTPPKTSRSGTSVATNPFEAASSTTTSGTSAAANSFEAPPSTSTSGTSAATNLFKAPSSTSVSGTNAAENLFKAPPSTSTSGISTVTNSFEAPSDALTSGTSVATNLFGAPSSTSTSGTSMATNLFEAPSSASISSTSAATNPFEAPPSTSTSGTSMATNLFEAPSSTSISSTSAATNPFEAPSNTSAPGTRAEQDEVTTLSPNSSPEMPTSEWDSSDPSKPPPGLASGYIQHWKELGSIETTLERSVDVFLNKWVLTLMPPEEALNQLDEESKPLLTWQWRHRAIQQEWRFYMKLYENKDRYLLDNFRIIQALRVALDVHSGRELPKDKLWVEEEYFDEVSIKRKTRANMEKWIQQRVAEAQRSSDSSPKKRKLDEEDEDEGMAAKKPRTSELAQPVLSSEDSSNGTSELKTLTGSLGTSTGSSENSTGSQHREAFNVKPKEVEEGFKVPNFGVLAGAGASFMAQFSKAAEKTQEEQKAKRKADEFDSDEDEGQWEREYEEQQRKKKARIQEAASKAVGFEFKAKQKEVEEGFNAKQKEVEEGFNAKQKEDGEGFKVPDFGVPAGAGARFMAQFSKAAEKTQDEQKAKRKADEFDSDEDNEEQWEREYEEEQRKKRARIEEAASKTAGFEFKLGGASTATATASPTGDHTWKPESPIRFGLSGMPSVSITAPSPVNPNKTDNPVARSLFGFDKNTPAEASKPRTSIFAQAPSENKPLPTFDFTKPVDSTPAQPQSNGWEDFLKGKSFASPAPSVFASPAQSVFASLTPSRAASPALTAATASGAESSANEEGDQDDEESKKEAQLDLGNANAGEENEDVLMTSRAKISEFAAKSQGAEEKIWHVRGVGELRVLQDKDTKKTRLVVRQDKSAKVLLNAGLLGGVSYGLAKPKLVNFTVAASDGGLSRWLIQVGKEEAAKELSELLEANKKH